jgi:hypothetical protein
MFCGTCGTELRPDTKVCAACGSRSERKVTVFDPTTRWVEAEPLADHLRNAPMRPMPALVAPAEPTLDLDDALDAGARRGSRMARLLGHWRHLPARDRVILGALSAMLVSLALPWVIIGDARVPAYRIGWPAALMAIALLAVMALVAFPRHFLYARALLSVPFAFGCCTLGGGGVVLALTWIMAGLGGTGISQGFGLFGATIYGAPFATGPFGRIFLGPDIGCFLFLVAAGTLIYAGYLKFIHEFPAVTSSNLALLPWRRPPPAEQQRTADELLATPDITDEPAEPIASAIPPAARLSRARWAGGAGMARAGQRNALRRR